MADARLSLFAALVLATCCVFAVIFGILLIRADSGSQLEPTLAPIPTQGVQPTQPLPDTPPMAVSNINPSEAAVGQEVTFDGSQPMPGSSPIASYEWDFGDGSTASGAMVTHPYANPGTYAVTLFVTGEDSLSNQGGPAQVTVHEQAPPALTDTPPPTEGPQRPTTTPPQQDTPVPEPILLPPVISCFEVAPHEVSVGGCFSLSWSAGGGTCWANIVRNDDSVWENAPLDSTIQDCPDKAGEYL